MCHYNIQADILIFVSRNCFSYKKSFNIFQKAAAYSFSCIRSKGPYATAKTLAPFYRNTNTRQASEALVCR